MKIKIEKCLKNINIITSNTYVMSAFGPVILLMILANVTAVGFLLVKVAEHQALVSMLVLPVLLLLQLTKTIGEQARLSQSRFMSSETTSSS